MHPAARRLVEGGCIMNQQAPRAILTVAAVYGYFLLFAQFSFVEIIRASGFATIHETILLGLMACAGVASGFLTARKGPSPVWIRLSLAAAAIAACVAGACPTMPALSLVAVATGIALGCSTVCVSALLPSWCGLSGVGVGTGLGYAVCNVPLVFQSTPIQQAWIAASIALVGVLAVPSRCAPYPQARRPDMPLGSAILLFTALVWMDSAAFFIIQHTADYQSATWGASHLWRNAGLHLIAAMASGYALSHVPKGPPLVGWLLIALAAYTVHSPASREVAGWLYPPGVSLYSVALVAWPGWFCGAADARAAAWKAAWLFALAGWFGSANGIGMAQTLQQIPTEFLLIAGAVVVFSMVWTSRQHWQILSCLGAVVLAGLSSLLAPDKPKATASERGRMVYLAEGCIHCHSRYPRPDSREEAIWGPALDPSHVLEEEPVLIGNRRQGPDLAHIGARRSFAWLKAHFLNPEALSPGSTMPGYAHLFEDARGDELVHFLRQSGIEHTHALLREQREWSPEPYSTRSDAPQLYERYCAVCHGEQADGQGLLASRLSVKPPDLRHGPFVRTADAEDLPLQIARVIKFGVIGSDMPGHETLHDSEIMALANLLAGWRDP
jgi:mono/diheme cytochrome c family protein